MKRSAFFVALLCAVLFSSFTAALVVMHAQAVYIGIAVGCDAVAVFALWKLLRARNESTVGDVTAASAALTAADSQ